MQLKLTRRKKKRKKLPIYRNKNQSLPLLKHHVPSKHPLQWLMSNRKRWSNIKIKSLLFNCIPLPPVNIIKLRLKILSPKRRRKSNTRSIRKK